MRVVHEAPEVTSEEINDHQEARRLFEARARELLNMSADEFLAQYDTGEIWNDPRGEAVTELAMLVPLAR